MKTIKCTIFVAIAMWFMTVAPVVSAQPPANDDFQNAIIINPLPFSDNIYTGDATTSDDPVASCGAEGRGSTVWYSFIPSADMLLQADTFGSDYDTVISVWTGSQGDFLEIACNDDADSLQSAVTFIARAEETYYFMVGAYDYGPGGNLVFAVQGQEYVPLGINVTLDPNGTVVAKTGVAEIHGTVTCSTEVYVQVFGNLKQKVGRHMAVGGFFTEVLCEGETVWSANVESSSGLIFGAGTTIVYDGGAFGCNNVECAFSELSGLVRLKGTKQ